jgi:polar amino acid transport system ATP-binding protein
LIITEVKHMAILEVKNIHKSFGNNEVLKGIDFSLEKGDVLVIIGSSGSGKTTLLRCLNFLETPDVGTITVGGETLLDASDKNTLSEKEIRRNRLHFGLVFQQFNLFPQYSVFDNLTLAPKLALNGEVKAEKKANKSLDKDYKNKRLKEIEKNANDLLERVGLSEKADAYPCELSGGQQQRVAIARALAMQPDILCFDEPTSALDPELTGEVLNVIRSLKTGNSTMIVVTHEMEFARNVADKVIFMANGVIEEQGTPEQVFGNPKSEILKAFLHKALDV